MVHAASVHCGDPTWKSREKIMGALEFSPPPPGYSPLIPTAGVSLHAVAAHSQN